MQDYIMKDIEGFEQRYAITSDGRVWSYYLNDFRKLQIDKKGYAYVTLCLLGTRNKKRIAVHRLVAQAFIPNPNNFQEINHKDENKLNNRVENLEWCNREYNIHYGTAQERSKITQQNTSPKRKAIRCIETGKIYQSGMEVKRELGIDNGSISKVCNGKKKTAGGYHWEFVNVEDNN